MAFILKERSLIKVVMVCKPFVSFKMNAASVKILKK